MKPEIKRLIRKWCVGVFIGVMLFTFISGRSFLRGVNDIRTGNTVEGVSSKFERAMKLGYGAEAAYWSKRCLYFSREKRGIFGWNSTVRDCDPEDIRRIIAAYELCRESESRRGEPLRKELERIRITHTQRFGKEYFEELDALRDEILLESGMLEDPAKENLLEL